MGKVGGDLLGRVIIATLKDRDPSLADMIQVEDGGNSSYSIVLSPENSDRIFLHCTGTNETFGLDDVDFDAVAERKAVSPRLPAAAAQNVSQRRPAARGDFPPRQAARRSHLHGHRPTRPQQGQRPGRLANRADKRSAARRCVYSEHRGNRVYVARVDYDRWQGDVLPHINREYLHTSG